MEATNVTLPSTDERTRLRNELLRQIIKNEAQRRNQPRAANNEKRK